ncbi:DUF6359 domain-containing protein [Sutcliffiella deserti]|uniref:DUF6359 domain-containing protein n=1 Tax=Sutcliffiella deserti TaxID=2875501 RepID=UPI001CBB878A|nr:5'-nucleotidase C-terminal domain-containing protein [Sutcliffiella deserti]
MRQSNKRFMMILLAFTLVFSNLLATANIPTAAAEEQSSAISVAEAIANNSGTATVEGYIVGTVGKYEGPFTVKTNLEIADSPDETDPNKILPVQIPNTNIRAEMNLVDNPENLHAKVHITGSLETYFSRPGLKNSNTFTIIEGGTEPEPQPEPELITIEAARQQSVGAEVIVEGVVTADNSAIGGGKLSTYIQDETAGINVFANSIGSHPDLKEGQKIEIRGKIAVYNGLLEVMPNTGGITIKGENQALPEPKSITIEGLQSATIAEPLEGQLVTVTGYVSNKPSSPAGGGYNVTLTDSDFNSTTLRVMEGTNSIDALETGKWYEITAILSQYNTYQILPRKASDIVLATEQPEPPSAAGEYPAIVERVTDGDTIRITTPLFGSQSVRYVNIDTPETYHSIKDSEGLDQNQMDHGKRATEYMQTLLKAGDEVILKVGEEPTDNYGRLLAQVLRKEDRLNTNLEMVKEGFAVTYFIWPVGDEGEYNEFQAAVKSAKDAGKGIWNEADPLLELPTFFRARYEGNALNKPVGNSDTKQYVEPTAWEDVPVEKRVFFWNEAEALAAGYTPVEDSGEEPIPGDLVSVQLLGLNDLHGKIDQTYDLSRDFGIAAAGRMDYVATYLKDRRLANPNTLIVHAGDMIGGSSPVAALLQDEPVVEIMNEIGFDIGTVGNHEFDEGTAEFLRMVNGGDHPNGTENYQGMNFPNVCANCVYKESGETILPPFEILEVGGEEIGFIGVNTTATLNMVMPEVIKDITFTNEVAAVNKATEELKAQGVKAIVVLAHMPASQSGETATGDAANLANNVDDEVDIIFAAHNHEIVDAIVDGKLIVQALDYGKAFSSVDIEIDPATGDIVTKEAEIVFVDQSKVDPDPAVSAILEKYENRIAPILNEVIGYAATAIEGGYSTMGEIGDNALGNLLADGMNAAMGSDFALMNGGGIRDNLNQGEITWGELFNIQPFNNVLMTVDIKGADLFTIMNAQLQAPYGPDYSIGGFKYTWDSSTFKVVDIMLPDGTPIDKDATYKLTVNNFMGTSTGSKYRPIGELGKNPVTGPEDLEATVEFIKSFNMDPINYEAEGRISEIQTEPGDELGTVTIAEARAAAKGTEVTIEGVVTTTSGAFGSKGFYVQDETAGTYVFQNSEDVVPGDVVKITGVVGEYNGEFQITSLTSFEKAGTEEVPVPLKVLVEEVNSSNEGQLVRVEGVEISDLTSVNSFGTFEFVASKDGESVVVRVDNRTGLNFENFAFENGDIVSITGVSSIFNDVIQLKPRGMADIVEYVEDSTITSNNFENFLTEAGDILIELVEEEEGFSISTEALQLMVELNPEAMILIEKGDVFLSIPLASLTLDQELTFWVEDVTAWFEDSISGVYDLTIVKENGDTISEFEVPVTITFAVDPELVENKENITVLYLNEEDEYEIVESALEEYEGMYFVSTDLYHFSIYGVFELEEVEDGNPITPIPPVVDEEDKKEDKEDKEDKEEKETVKEDKKTDKGNKLPNTATSTYSFMLMGAILLIAGAAGVVLFRRRKIA